MYVYTKLTYKYIRLHTPRPVLANLFIFNHNRNNVVALGFKVRGDLPINQITPEKNFSGFLKEINYKVRN